MQDSKLMLINSQNASDFHILWVRKISTSRHLRVRIIHVSPTFGKNLLVEKILLAKLCKWSKKLTSSPDMHNLHCVKTVYCSLPSYCPSKSRWWSPLFCWQAETRIKIHNIPLFFFFGGKNGGKLHILNSCFLACVFHNYISMSTLRVS